MRFCFLIVYTFVCLYCHAQQFPVLKYSTSDGLGHQVVYRIYQDKKGLLWFSTDNGLTRFDGREFRNYTAKDGLQSNFIFTVVSHDTTMLVSTFGGGVHTFDGHHFRPLRSIGKEILYPINIVYADSVLWIVDRNFDLFKIRGNRTVRYPKPKDIFYYSVQPVGGGVFVGSTKLLTASAEHDSLTEIPVNIPWPSTSYLNMLPISNSDWLLSTGDAIYRFDLTTHTATRILTGDFSGATRNMIKTSEYIWIAETKGRVWRLSNDLKDKQIVFDNVVVNDLFEDKDHNIWLATYGQGLWCVPSTNIAKYELPGLLYPSVYYSRHLQCPLLTSTNGGTYSLVGNNLERISLLKGNIDRERITCFFESSANEAVIGTLSWIARRKGKSQQALLLSKAQSAIYKDSHGSYWAGMRMGLAKIDSTFTRYNFLEPFDSRIVRCITEINDELAVGTDNGLFIKNGNAWVHINKLTGLENEYVNAVQRDTVRNITWIGTHEGIFVMNDRLQLEKKYPDIRCNTILIDKHHNVWAATSIGLLFFDGYTFSFFGEKEGLATDLNGMAYSEAGHELYVLSSQNLYAISITNFLKDQQHPHPGVSVDEQWADTVKLKNQNASLPGSVQSLKIKLCIPAFKNFTHWNTYYRHNEHAWVNAGKNTELNFLELPYGKNLIEVKLRDDINDLSSEVLTLQYTVDTPFFRKRRVIIAAAVLLIILTASLTVFLGRYLSKKKQRTFFEQQRRAELEQKVLRNMLNPHFMNNALNSIQAFVTRNDQRKTLGYLAKFARLMRINLELLEKNMVSLEKELQNLELYLEFEVLRSEGKLTYSIDVSPDINREKIKVPSLVLQPFVENAIWHGILPRETGGHVSITAREIDRRLHISITDNGIGLHEAKQRKNNIPGGRPSRGLALIQERFTILNQQVKGHRFSLKDISANQPGATGAIVEIELPVRY